MKENNSFNFASNFIAIHSCLRFEKSDFLRYHIRFYSLSSFNRIETIKIRKKMLTFGRTPQSLFSLSLKFSSSWSFLGVLSSQVSPKLDVGTTTAAVVMTASDSRHSFPVMRLVDESRSKTWSRTFRVSRIVPKNSSEIPQWNMIQISTNSRVLHDNKEKNTWKGINETCMQIRPKTQNLVTTN